MFSTSPHVDSCTTKSSIYCFITLVFVLAPNVNDIFPTSFFTFLHVLLKTLFMVCNHEIYMHHYICLSFSFINYYIFCTFACVCCNDLSTFYCSTFTYLLTNFKLDNFNNTIYRFANCIQPSTKTYVHLHMWICLSFNLPSTWCVTT